MLDWPEIVLRLGVATLAGALIGLNRDLHGKPIGLNTLGLVGLATAMVVVLADPSGGTAKISAETSRVIQGILTGIGFLGAGVIVRAEHHFRVRGLTSAACTWLTACFGSGLTITLRPMQVRTSPANRSRPCSSPEPALSRWSFRNWLPRSCVTICGAGNPPTGIR